MPGRDQVHAPHQVLAVYHAIHGRGFTTPCPETIRNYYPCTTIIDTLPPGDQVHAPPPTYSPTQESSQRQNRHPLDQCPTDMLPNTDAQPTRPAGCSSQFPYSTLKKNHEPQTHLHLSLPPTKGDTREREDESEDRVISYVLVRLQCPSYPQVLSKDTRHRGVTLVCNSIQTQLI
jgi:hypothetical protein